MHGQRDQPDGRGHQPEVRRNVVVPAADAAELVGLGWIREHAAQHVQDQQRQCQREEDGDRLAQEQLQFQPAHLEERSHGAVSILGATDDAQEDILQRGAMQPKVGGFESPADQPGTHVGQYRSAPGDNDGPALDGHRVDVRNRLQPRHVRVFDREQDLHLGRVPSDQCLRCALGHYSVVVDDGEPVAQPLGLVHEVGDQDHRRASVPDTLDQRPARAASSGVEPGRHLVQEDHLGAVGQREGDEEPLPLAAREAGEGRIAFPREVPLGEKGVRVDSSRAQRGEQVKRLPDLHPIRQSRLLQLSADPAAKLARLFLRIEAQHAKTAAVWPAQPLQALHSGRLASSVWAQQPEDLTLRDLERHVLDRDQRAVVLPQTRNRDDRDHGAPPDACGPALPPRNTAFRSHMLRPDSTLAGPPRMSGAGPGPLATGVRRFALLGERAHASGEVGSEPEVEVFHEATLTVARLRLRAARPVRIGSHEDQQAGGVQRRCARDHHHDHGAGAEDPARRHACRPLRAAPVRSLSYLLSFIYIGIYWNNHHHMLQLTERITGGVLWANLHLLFWLSLFPFVTAWMGENDFARTPVVVYGVACSRPPSPTTCCSP